MVRRKEHVSLVLQPIFEPQSSISISRFSRLVSDKLNGFFFFTPFFLVFFFPFVVFIFQKFEQKTSHGINSCLFFSMLFGPNKHGIQEPPPLLAELSSRITSRSSNYLLGTTPLKYQRPHQIWTNLSHDGLNPAPCFLFFPYH